MNTHPDRRERARIRRRHGPFRSPPHTTWPPGGVLEYVPAEPGSTRRRASLRLLRKIRDSLSENGILLLAIENRLGTKYWTGCGEDHTTRLFDGLLGYPDDTPITFSRDELEALLREAGFKSQQFYHVHPDYKLPTTVIREVADLGTVAVHQWTQQFAQDYMNPREYLMPDPLLMKSLEAAGLFWQFSNSFLVLCSPSDSAPLKSDWLIKKFSNTSRPELHHTITLVEREELLRVERTPLRYGRARVDLGDYEWALSDGDYTPGTILMTEAYEALVSQRWFEGLTALCGELLEAARTQFATEQAPEDGCFDVLDGGALDFTFWNVVRCRMGRSDRSIRNGPKRRGSRRLRPFQESLLLAVRRIAVLIREPPRHYEAPPAAVLP